MVEVSNEEKDDFDDEFNSEDKELTSRLNEQNSERLLKNDSCGKLDYTAQNIQLGVMKREAVSSYFEGALFKHKTDVLEPRPERLALDLMRLDCSRAKISSQADIQEAVRIKSSASTNSLNI